MSETVDNKIKGEVGLEDALGIKGKGSVVEVDPQTGKITVSQKEEKRRKKDVEIEKAHDEICKIWAKDIGQNAEIWFYQQLSSSVSGATQALVLIEPLETFFDEKGNQLEDVERWLSYRAEGGYSYVCQLRINGKAPANQPVRKYYYKEDGEIYTEWGGFKKDNMDNKKSRGDNNTEAVIDYADKTNKLILEMSDKKESNDPSIIKSLTDAIIAKDGGKGNNDGIVPALMSGFTAIIQAVASKPVEQKNDNTLFIEMFKSVSEGMKEMGRGTNESINKISQMMLDMNRIMLEIQTKSMELRSNDKIETMKMMAEMQEKMLLVVKEMKEKGGDSAGVAGLDHVNKFLDQALKTQGLMSGFNAQLMGGMMNSFKDSVAVMKDLKDLRGDGESKEKESETVLDKIINKAPAYMEAGAKFVNSMRGSNQFPINNDAISGHNNLRGEEKVVEPIEKNEMTEKELLNDIIEDIMGYLEDKKSHEEIAENVVGLYSDYKDKLISILNKGRDELMSILSGDNLNNITKNYNSMKNILGLIKKKLI